MVIAARLSDWTRLTEIADGGGVRGISALILLEQLMDVANDMRAQQGLPKQEPWEMFDMIGGTSTGGQASRLSF